jgi:heat shock protein HtpX
MNIFLDIFRIIDELIRFIANAVITPANAPILFSINQLTTTLAELQSFFLALVLLVPVVSLVVCKIVRQDAYSVKTNIWLFTLLLPTIIIPLRFLVTQVFLLVSANPADPGFQISSATEFLTYCGIQLIIVCFAFIFTFKRLRLVGNRKDALASKFLASCEKSEEYNQISDIASNLAQLMNVDAPEILVLNLEDPIIFTVDERKKKPLIVVSSGLIELLDTEELEACLGHELAHIMNRDSSVRRASSFLRAVTFYNPVGYFIESAIYCDREFLADVICARVTKKPEALASALIKIAENVEDSGGSLVKQKVMCLFKSYKFLPKKHPPLEERLKRLMRLVETREFL